MSGTPTTAARWLSGTVTVTVTDGRLTVTNATGASNNKICFIDITSAGPAQPSLTINDVSILEGDSGVTNAIFTVTLSAASTQTVTVNYATAPGTATAGSDYTSVAGTLIFTPGQTTQTITVPVIGDTIVEPNETFFVNLSEAGGATIARSQGIGTIVNDDDPPVTFAARINFQPAGAPIPAGYVADTGLTYRAQGSFSFGWSFDNTGGARDRDNPISPDQRYDTLNHLSGQDWWEIAVPNGQYNVTIVAGDPDYLDSVYRINVENVLAVNGTPTTAARWLTGSVTVNVTDGRLSLTNATGASNNKICFIDISAVSGMIAMPSMAPPMPSVSDPEEAETMDAVLEVRDTETAPNDEPQTATSVQEPQSNSAWRGASTGRSALRDVVERSKDRLLLRTTAAASQRNAIFAAWQAIHRRIFEAIRDDNSGDTDG